MGVYFSQVLDSPMIRRNASRKGLDLAKISLALSEWGAKKEIQTWEVTNTPYRHETRCRI
jgi:hypothetical protein